MKKITITFILSGILLLTSCLGREGTVRVGSNMESYALEYLEEHEILLPDEKIFAYYDYTISCDGTTAAIITNNRWCNHNMRKSFHQETTTTYFSLDEITKIHSYEESIAGLFIEVWKGDELMMIEIAHWQGGETFLNILKMKSNVLD